MTKDTKFGIGYGMFTGGVITIAIALFVIPVVTAKVILYFGAAFVVFGTIVLVVTGNKNT